MKKHFTFFLFSLLSFTSFAATFTWLGGSGNWNSAAGWDLGSIPSAADEVVIPSGTVYIPNGYTARVKQVTISQSAILKIYGQGTLGVENTLNADAIYVAGSLYNYGRVVVINFSSSSSGFWDAFHVFGSLYNYGDIDIDSGYDDARGFFVEGNMSNRGTIDVQGGVTTVHLYNGRFINSTNGTITSTGSGQTVFTTSTAAYFKNYGDILAIDNDDSSVFHISTVFENKAAGNIEVTGSAFYSGITLNSPGSFLNEGNIEIDGSIFTGIQTQGFFENKKGANIEISNIGTYSIWNLDGFINGGDIILDENSVTSLSNNGSFENLSTGYIFFQELDNLAGATFDNYGSLDHSTVPTAYGGLDNYGDFTNHHCGEIHLRHNLRNYAGATLVNDGVIFNEGMNPNTNSGTLDNYGIIEDNPGNLHSLFNNQKIVGLELAGPFFSGVPVPDALELGSLTDYTIFGWYTSPAQTTSAGTYNAATNEFTPNGNGVGISPLYVLAGDHLGGCKKLFKINVASPFTGGSGSSALIFGGTGNPMSGISVFPNPSNGQFKIRLSDGKESEYEMILADVSGKIILQKSQVVDGEKVLDLSPKNHLPEGVYFLKIFRNGQPIQNERLVVTR